MNIGDRVREGDRVGLLLGIYEIDPRLQRKAAMVKFDDDKIPTRGVWLDQLRPETGSESADASFVPAGSQKQ